MLELVDNLDLESRARKGVGVRIPLYLLTLKNKIMNSFDKHEAEKQMKPVCINGRVFCQNTENEVRRIFGDIAKKIIITKQMISVVI